MQALVQLKLIPGTAASPSLLIPAGVNLTTPVAGSVGYDAKALYFTPDILSGRGVIDAGLLAVLSAPAAISSAVGAQRIFATPTTGALTLAANTTYLIDSLITLTVGTGLASNNFSFGGTATVTSVMYETVCLDVAAAATTGTATTAFWTSMAGGAMDAANTSPNTAFTVKGVIRVNAGGTIIPQIAFSGAPGGTPQINTNSFMKFTAVGNGTVNQIGAWA